MINLLKALAEFQQEVPTIHEDTKGYNYTYANLGQIFKVIKPLLKKYVYLGRQKVSHLFFPKVLKN